MRTEKANTIRRNGKNKFIDQISNSENRLLLRVIFSHFCSNNPLNNGILLGTAITNGNSANMLEFPPKHLEKNSILLVTHVFLLPNDP